MTKFDSNKCKVVADAIKAALAEVEKEHGIEVTFNGGKYDANSFTPKIIIVGAEKDGTFKDEARLRLEDSIYSDFADKKIKVNGEEMTIVGYKPRSYKFPFIALSKSGQRYKITKTHALT